MTDNKKSVIYALLTVLFWSTVATAFKLGLREVSVRTMLMWASIVSTLVLLPFAIYEKKSIINWKQILSSAVLGFLNPFAYYLVLFLAYDLLPAQLAQPLNYTWPIVLSLMAVPFLGHKIGFMGFIGLIVSFIGVLLLSFIGHKNFDVSVFGILIALGSSIIWATYWIFNSRGDSGIRKLFYNFCFGTLYIVLLNAILGFEIPSKMGLITSAYAGIFEMGLAFVLWSKALKYSDNTSKTGSLVYFAPFLSLFLIGLILQEPIKLASLFGLCLVIIGTILIRSKKFTASTKPSQ